VPDAVGVSFIRQFQLNLAQRRFRFLDDVRLIFLILSFRISSRLGNPPDRFVSNPILLLETASRVGTVAQIGWSVKALECKCSRRKTTGADWGRQMM